MCDFSVISMALLPSFLVQERIMFANLLDVEEMTSSITLSCSCRYSIFLNFFFKCVCVCVCERNCSSFSLSLGKESG